MKKILVVVDMQNDFIDGPLGTPEAREIVGKVCKKILGCEWNSIFATMDTHFDTYLETQEGRKLPIEHCIYGTHGQKLNEKIQEAITRYPKSLDKCVPVIKTRFGSTVLVELLENFIHKTREDLEITLVGICTDICVISNALMLKSYLPEARIIVDASCCAGSSPEKHLMALSVMESCQIDILNESEG